MSETKRWEGLSAPGKKVFYILVCRECGNGHLPMPFESAAARGKWAAEHTRGTGHDRWFVADQPALPDAG